MLGKTYVSLILFICFNYIQMVDKGNFKTCDQSGFCRRIRKHKDLPQWHLLSETVQEINDGTGIEAHLKHLHLNVVLKLELFSVLHDGDVLRMRINELESDRARFEARDSLVENIEYSKIKLISHDAHKCVVGFGPNEIYRAELNVDPFRIDIFSGDTLVISGNQRGLFHFEHYREKHVPPPEEPKPEPNIEDFDFLKEDKEEEKKDDSLWEETFKSWTDFKPFGPMSVAMDFTFVNFDHVYGIPEHADSFALRNTKDGDPYRLYNLDVFEYEVNSRMALYGSIPMMVAHSTERTVGLLWLNPSETWVDIETAGDGVVGLLAGLVSGDSKSRLTHWISETGVIDVWFMMGPKPVDVMRQNARITGTPKMPPYYSVGHHQCRWNYFSQKEVAEVDDKFDEYDIPLDAVWLDIEYTEGRSKKYFTWDKVMFSDPKSLITNLTTKGRRLITILDPHIKKDSDYVIYNELVQNSFLIKHKEGNDFEGWCWPGAAMYPDLINPAVREWWSSKFRPEFFPGFEGGVIDVWNDMNEPSVFNGPEITAHKDLRHVNGWEHRDVHNIYGFYLTQATFNGLMKYRPNFRPFILTRAFFAGSQRYCAAWTGDNMAKWEHLKAVVPMLLSLSIVGMSFSGADVPGFFFNPPSEELVVRWYQAGAFQPFYRAHAHLDTKRREPWTFSEQTRRDIRDAIRLRYSYLPYMYTLFYESAVDGIPVVRPLWFHYPKDVNAFGIDDAYLLGDSILVHPITDAGVTSIKIYFPGTSTDTWYEPATNKIYTGGNPAIVGISSNTIPYFQKGGSIIPKRERMRRSAALTLHDPLTFDVVLSVHKTANGKIYLDDGYTFNYENGDYIIADVTYKDKTLAYTPSGNHSTQVWLERIRVFNIATKPHAIMAITASGAKIPLTGDFNDVRGILVIRKPKLNLGESWKLHFA